MTTATTPAPSTVDVIARHVPTRAARAWTGPFAAALLLTHSAVGTTASLESKPDLRNLAWLSGVWRGHNGPDDVEEVWGPVSNNEILATFKAITAGSDSRFEIRRIYSNGGKIVFDELAGPSLTSLTLITPRVLLSTDKTHANFTNLVLTRLGDQKMQVTVTLPATATGVGKVVSFELTRVMALQASP